MKSAYIEVIEDCNLRCVFCSRGDAKGTRPPEEVKALLDKYSRDGYKKAILTGGETLLYPELEGLVEYGSSLGFDVAVQTNGVFADKKKTKALKKAGLDQLIFSIHSHIPIMVDRIMKGKGVLEKQLAGLRNANDAGLVTPVTALVLRPNYRILPSFFKFMTKNYPFVEHYTLNFVDPIGRSKDNNWVVPKLSEVEVFLAKSLLILKNSGKTFRVERVPLCYLLEFAEYNTELRRIWSKEPAIIHRERESISYTDGYFDYEYVRGDACEFCQLRGICPGVDKHYAEVHGTDELYPVFADPDIILKDAGED